MTVLTGKQEPWFHWMEVHVVNFGVRESREETCGLWRSIGRRIVVVVGGVVIVG